MIMLSSLFLSFILDITVWFTQTFVERGGSLGSNWAGGGTSRVEQCVHVWALVGGTGGDAQS